MLIESCVMMLAADVQERRKFSGFLAVFSGREHRHRPFSRLEHEPNDRARKSRRDDRKQPSDLSLGQRTPPEKVPQGRKRFLSSPWRCPKAFCRSCGTRTLVRPDPAMNRWAMRCRAAGWTAFQSTESSEEPFPAKAPNSKAQASKGLGQ